MIVKLAAIVLSKFKLDWIDAAILRAEMTNALKRYVLLRADTRNDVAAGQQQGALRPDADAKTPAYRFLFIYCL